MDTHYYSRILTLRLDKMKVASPVLVLLARLMLQVDAATVEVSTCDELEMATAATAIEDTTVIFTSPAFTTLDCTTTNDEGYSVVRSFIVENNILTLEAPDALGDVMRLTSIRFNLTNSGELLVTQDARFQSDSDNIAVVSLSSLLSLKGLENLAPQNLSSSSRTVFTKIVLPELPLVRPYPSSPGRTNAKFDKFEGYPILVCFEIGDPYG